MRKKKLLTHRTSLNSRRGFTLLEVLIVIIILGVIAGIAVPIYSIQVEKARAQEAIQMLGAIRDSMLRSFATRGSYADLQIQPKLAAGSPAEGPKGKAPLQPDATLGKNGQWIDYDSNNPIGGQTQFFEYDITAKDDKTFTITATRVDEEGLPIGNNTITIQENGIVTRNGDYA